MDKKLFFILVACAFYLTGAALIHFVPENTINNEEMLGLMYYGLAVFFLTKGDSWESRQ